MTEAEVDGAIGRGAAGPVGAPEPVDRRATSLADVDFLKKVRLRGRRRAAVAAVAGVVLTLAGVLLMYCAGSAAPRDAVVSTARVDGATVTLTAKAASDAQRIARVTWSYSNGMVSARVYTTPRLFFDNEARDYTYTVDTAVVGEDAVAQVRIGDAVVWEDGADIGRMAAELYAACNPFVGDMPANARIAAALGIAEQLGPYTNELQTDRVPYGWTLRLEEPVPASREVLAVELMRTDACVLLALVKNLGSVTWEYLAEDGVRTLTVTEQEADVRCGGSVKEAASSASGVQALLDALGLGSVG